MKKKMSNLYFPQVSHWRVAAGRTFAAISVLILVILRCSNTQVTFTSGFDSDWKLKGRM